jgi:hypothetical protein
MRAPILMSIFAGVLAALAPQDASESRPSPADKDPAEVRKALTALLDAKGFRLSGDASSRNPEDDAGGITQVMVLGSGSAGTPFSGGIEVQRTAKGDLFLMSKSRLPGFAAFDDGERAIVSSTYENDPPDTSTVVGDLTSLLKLDELLKAAGSGASSKTDAESGATTWTFPLPKRLVKSTGGGPLAVTQPRVKSAHATVVVSRDCVATSLTLAVTRTDPLARIRRRAIEQASEGEGGTMAASPEDLGGDDDGATARYTLKPATAEPSKRMTSELERLRSLVSDG